MKKCKFCDGTGKAPCSTDRPCNECHVCDGEGVIEEEPGVMSRPLPPGFTMTVNLKDMDPELIKLYYGQDYPMNPKFKPAAVKKDPWDGCTLDKKLELLAASIRAEERLLNRVTELRREAEKAHTDHRTEQDYRKRLEAEVARDLRKRGNTNPW